MDHCQTDWSLNSRIQMPFSLLDPALHLPLGFRILPSPFALQLTHMSSVILTIQQYSCLSLTNSLVGCRFIHLSQWPARHPAEVYGTATSQKHTHRTGTIWRYRRGRGEWWSPSPVQPRAVNHSSKDAPCRWLTVPGAHSMQRLLFTPSYGKPGREELWR